MPDLLLWFRGRIRILYGAGTHFMRVHLSALPEIFDEIGLPRENWVFEKHPFKKHTEVSTPFSREVEKAVGVLR